MSKQSAVFFRGDNRDGLPVVGTITLGGNKGTGPCVAMAVFDAFIFDKIRPNIVVHMAAMKHVNLVEENPIQGTKINVQGSLNVISASLRTDVPITVGLSTDKACSPKNVYGYSKSILEHCFIEANTDRNKFACTRFANVALTSDSVIPLWKTLIKQDKPLKLTDVKMTRLMF